MRVIDFHVHFTGNLSAAERFVSLWREAGIEKAVVFAITRGDGSHASVAEIGALGERFPDFFVPFAYITPGHEDCIAEVRAAVARGFKGVKFIFPAKPYDDDEYFPIYELAAKAGMVCLFHTGIVYGTAVAGVDFEYQRRWRISSAWMRPVHLDRIARAFPGMPIIGAHLGSRAWHEEATHVMRWSRNVYFDLSIGQLHYERKRTKPGEDARAIVPRMQELYDTGQLDLLKVLFGSDSFLDNEGVRPDWAMRTVRFELDKIGATAEEKEAVWGGIAARLLGL
ncbi:MAG: amidohydrolase family protein [Planctomycetota bacterium]